jgi:hypothetical protein
MPPPRGGRADRNHRQLAERPSVRDAVVTDFQDRLRDYVREKGGYLANLALAQTG